MADYNAVIYASNAKYFDGVTHSMPVDTVHTLGADTKQVATLGTGWVDNGAHSYTATAATSSLSNLSTAATNNVQINFTVSAWTAGSVGGYSANGTYTIDVTTDSLDAIGFSGDVLINSVQEITIPTASYIQYLAYPSLTWKQLSSTVDYGYGLIPVSTTWPLTESFQVAITSTAPLSADDILELNADQDLVFKVWDGTVASLPSGFSAANIVGFLDGTSGNTGKWVQDISIPLGTQLCTDSGFDSATEWTGYIDAVVASGVCTFTNVPNISSIRNYPSTPTPVITGGYAYLCTFNINSISLGAFVVRLYNATSSIGDSSIFNTTGKKVSIITAAGDGDGFGIMASGTTSGVVDNLTVERITAWKEIANFTSNVNTTYLNGTTGVTNLKLIKDASGRTTGTATAGTTQWAADGRSAVTGWTITAPFTVTEIVDGVTYTWTSDGNKYIDSVASGTYTLPTGVWTLSDNLLFDGVTTGTVRGNAQMINSVVIP